MKGGEVNANAQTPCIRSLRHELFWKIQSIYGFPIPHSRQF
jgi:hypothetical protein